MKKKFITLLFLTGILLCACSSGVTQKDYESVVTEKEELQKKYDELFNSFDEIASKYAEKLNGQSEKELETITLSAWAKNYFGEDCIYLIDNPKYLQCIASGKYDSTPESISELWETFKKAIVSASIKELDYECIAVKYLAEDGTTLIEFTVRKQGTNYTLDSITGNLMKTDSISAALNIISK